MLQLDQDQQAAKRSGQRLGGSKQRRLGIADEAYNQRSSILALEAVDQVAQPRLRLSADLERQRRELGGSQPAGPERGGRLVEQEPDDPLVGPQEFAQERRLPVLGLITQLDQAVADQRRVGSKHPSGEKLLAFSPTNQVQGEVGARALAGHVVLKQGVKRLVPCLDFGSHGQQEQIDLGLRESETARQVRQGQPPVRLASHFNALIDLGARCR